MTMTETGEGLLRGILDNPEDDARRLVYADWLEEQGDAVRAEFIRVQCRIAALEKDCRCVGCVRKRGGGQHHNGPCAVDQERDELADGRSRQALLRRRERELLVYWRDFIGYEFLSFIPSDALFHDHMPLTRGFVESVTCTSQTWLAYAGAIMARHPVQRVTLTDRELPPPIRLPGYSGKCGWFAYEGEDQPDNPPPTQAVSPSWLPWSLARLLVTEDRPLRHADTGRIVFEYDSPELGLEALAQACLTYGRRMARQEVAQ